MRLHFLLTAICLLPSFDAAAKNQSECTELLEPLIQSSDDPGTRIAKLEEIAAKCKGNGRFYFAQASALVAKNEIDRAIEVLEVAIKDEGLDHQLANRTFYASLILQKGQVDRALTIAKELEKTAPNEHAVLILLADSHFRKAQFTEVIRYAISALRIEHVDVLYPMLIYSHYKLGDYQGSVSAYELARRSKVPDILIYGRGNSGVAAAHAYYELGEFKQASYVLSEQIRLVPALQQNPFVQQLQSGLESRGEPVK